MAEEEKKEEFVHEKEKEIGRIIRENSSDIVVRIYKYKNVVYVDIRHWVKNFKGVTGFRKGLSIPEKDFPKLMEILRNTEKRLSI